MSAPKKILIIQTSFIGDVILATSLLESLHAANPEQQIHFLVRKGNEGLFEGHPFIKKLHVWEKTSGKLRNLIRVIGHIRKERFDLVINLHRFLSSGLISAFSGANLRIGFDKNPLSWIYSTSVKHRFSVGHEIERNHTLIASLVSEKNPEKPRLYPCGKDVEKVLPFQGQAYVCIAPTSVWFTKQWPKEKWLELILLFPETKSIYLLGSNQDSQLCEWIKSQVNRPNIIVLAGKLTLLQSAALMAKAQMNYVNDSAPMHLASAMNAPTTAIFCSTIPGFGFGPLSDVSKIVEHEANLECRPCGLHGFNSCPKGHFKCALEIKASDAI